MHKYLSTACFHKECGKCRRTCKYCPARCAHDCHSWAASKSADFKKLALDDNNRREDGHAS